MKIPQWQRIALMLLSSILLFSTAWAVSQTKDTTLADTTPWRRDVSTTASGFGFATSLAGLPANKLASTLDGMKSAGATWVRFDLSWDDVQPTPGNTYNWAAYDEVIRAAQSRNLKVIMILNFTPAWARPASCSDSTMCAPADASAYGRFAGEAAKHFAPAGVRYWEVWNEPNISYRFRPSADPNLYASMLRAAYTAVKQVDPQAVVIAASTAPSATNARNYGPADFLAALYTDGAAGSFDAISSHPYTYPNTPARADPSDAWGQLQAMHKLMDEHGDGGKQIWITEFSAPTNGPNIPGDHVSEEQQAQTLAEAAEIFSRFAWAGPLLWYDYQDAGNRSWTSEDFYGLVRHDGSFKPAYYTFKETVAKYSK